METLHVNGHVVKYNVRKVAESNYVHMKFRPNLELEVSIPSNRQVDVERLLQKKRKWIERTYDEITMTRRIFDGKHVFYKGTRYRVLFTRNGNRAVRIGNGKLLLPQRKGERDTDALKRWMSSQTGRLVRRRLDTYRRKHKFAFNGFSVKDTKRWAYCTSGRHLIFNWALITLPGELADYVILHEISHLTEFNHSQRFRYALAALCPDFKQKELMLKRYAVD